MTINSKKGSLVIVGTGILTPAHLSQGSIARIKHADVVHALVPDPLGLSTIEKLNDNVKNLAEYYFDDKSDKNGNNRLDGYKRMVEVILVDVRRDLRVCCIFYGHPGVFVYPSHSAIEIARSEGFEAIMLPAISAEDCLYADLGIDPGNSGCISYEASQYIFYRHVTNIAAILILWQIGVVGDVSLQKLEPASNGLEMLQEKLLQSYPMNHQVIIYEASTLPLAPARVERVILANINKVKTTTITTLIVPPTQNPEINIEFCRKWEIDISSLS